jgi:DUF4097 and DUF4098 domain-containing protein YvlB
MKNKKINFGKTILMLLICGLFYLNAYNANAQINIKEEKVNTKFNKTLSVKLNAGDVIVATWDKEEINVKITGNEAAKENFDFFITPTDDGIDVKSEKKSKNQLKNVNLKVEITIPYKYEANINIKGGDIILKNLTGNIILNTAGGDIIVENINGISNLNTAGGDIKLINFSGDVNVNTAGGDIVLSGSGGKVNSNTAGGDIKLTYAGENKGLSLNTAGGDIVVNIPENFQADCSLTSMGGDIESDIPVDGITKPNKDKPLKKLYGKMNSGGSEFKCSTSGGDIIVKKN